MTDPTHSPAQEKRTGILAPLFFPLSVGICVGKPGEGQSETLRPLPGLESFGKHRLATVLQPLRRASFSQGDV